MEWFPNCQVGGLDRYFYEQLEALSRTGEVRGTAVVTSCDPIDHGSIKVRAMAREGASLFRRWAGARAEARRAFAEGVDLVNAHFALYAFPLLSLIPKNVPLVVNFQGPWANEIRAESTSWKRRLTAGAARLIERRVYRRADRIITLSAAFRDLVCTRYGVDRARVRVVAGAADLGRYLQAPPREAARAKLGLPHDRIIAVSVRRLARRMGLELLIDAVQLVRQSHPELLLLIGGKGPLRGELEERIRRADLGEHVRMLGFVPEEDLPALYAAADFSVVPTIALEGFGLVTVESLASGTPVLGTPVGATPEILNSLDARLVFEAPTSEAMARKLRDVLQATIKLPTREECRAHVQRYGWPSVVPKILDVYREAIEERRHS
ncbi:MAG TPA: glycosyltransferase family 4 protein [Chthoniobacteraceae bacterium]|nr:glycosyltransferase family 4 protein [Chthoniobacteraceae bacterium]